MGGSIVEKLRNMPGPETHEIEQCLLDLIAENQRGIEAVAARSALEQDMGVSLSLDAFDELVLRLQQLDRITEDQTTNPPRRILRTRIRLDWRLPTQIANEREIGRAHV